jgi:hypothetical protein
VPESLLSPTELLYQRAASIRAVQGREMNQFTRATQLLERVADQLQAPIAIVGGLAAIYHQVPVTTVDIDIVVPKDKLDDFLVLAAQQGLIVARQSPSGWHAIEYHDPDGNVEIQVVPEGGRSPRDPAHAPPTPSPQQLGVSHGLGYASFAGWVALKLVAAREKDRYHLIEALKQATQEQIASAVVWARQMHPSYLQEFQRLMRAAEDENQEKW